MEQFEQVITILISVAMLILIVQLCKFAQDTIQAVRKQKADSVELSRILNLSR